MQKFHVGDRVSNAWGPEGTVVRQFSSLGFNNGILYEVKWDDCKSQSLWHETNLRPARGKKMVYGSTVNLKPERKSESVGVLSGQFNWAVVNKENYVIALFSQKRDAENFQSEQAFGTGYSLREVENI